MNDEKEYTKIICVGVCVSGQESYDKSGIRYRDHVKGSKERGRWLEKRW